MAEQFLHEPAGDKKKEPVRTQESNGTCMSRVPTRSRLSPERLIEIRDQIVGILEADRQPHHALRHAGARSSSSVWPHCDVSTGRLLRLSTPPRLAARLIDLQPVEEPRGAVVAAAEVEADHPAEPAHLPRARSRDRDATRSPG